MPMPNYTYSDGQIDVEMQETVTTLKKVSVSAGRSMNVQSPELGVCKLSMATIKQIPSVFGESDVLKSCVNLTWRTVGRGSYNGF